jgi:para-aminobenzoate synthetase component 1
VAETTTITLSDADSFKAKALIWANHFRVVCLLDSNDYRHEKYKSKEWVLAVDAVSEIHSDAGAVNHNSFHKLDEFRANTDGIIFGFLAYDLKNEIENLGSKNFDGLKFPELFFFKPRYIFEITGDKLTVNRNYPETFELVERIRNQKTENRKQGLPIKLKARTSKENYLQNVEKIRMQIEAGDFYEMNYCNEFYAEEMELEPVETFLKLNEKSKAPFSCYFKLEDKYLLCASPERFLRKEGNKLVSQPIKGTIRKGNSAEENAALKAQLKSDLKERAENIMIVDLVRNDLARSSKPGTVAVEELCGIYEFNSVNQMISTVTSELETGLVEAIKNAFPMGSMTGAPKIEVMKNIEHYEDFKRGLYSGSVGYFTAEGDFDLNVIIRSIFYNASQKYLSIRVGGALTYDSVPENEWNEILLKAKGMIEVLNAEILD